MGRDDRRSRSAPTSPRRSARRATSSPDVGAGAVGGVAADVVAATSGLPTAQLSQIADGLAARLQELGDAVTAGNLAGTGPAVGALNALLDQYDVLRADLEEPLADLADLSSRAGRRPATTSRTG